MAEKNADAAVKVRVLVANGDHLPNHVITLSAAEAKSAVGVWADDNADAVAWAEANEPQPELVLEKPAQA